MSEELINKIKEYIPDFNGYSQENFIESESSIRKKSIEELQIGMNLIKEQLNNKLMLFFSGISRTAEEVALTYVSDIKSKIKL